VGVTKHRASVHVAAVLLRARCDVAVCCVQFFPPHHSWLFGAALIPLVRDANVSANALEARHRDGAFRWAPAVCALGVFIPLA
jgi:hypothetical protein